MIFDFMQSKSVGDFSKCQRNVVIFNTYFTLSTIRHGQKLGFMGAFVKASAYALTQAPTVNAVIDGTDIIYRDYVDISVAVATPKVKSSDNIEDGSSSGSLGATSI